MPNCAIYVLPPPCFPSKQNRFNSGTGDYSFLVHWETSDVNGSYREVETGDISWSSSDQQIDNAIMDAVIADALNIFSLTITRNDCRVFR